MKIRPILVLAGLAVACGTPTYLGPNERIPVPDLAKVGPSVRAEVEKRKTELENRIARRAGSEQVGDAFGKLGMLYHAYNFRPEAGFCYEKAVVFAPGSLRWHYFFARILELQTQSEAAYAQFEKALNIDPEHVPSLIAAAEHLRQKNELAGARERFERASTLPGGKVTGLTGLAQIALARNENQGARDLLEQGLVHEPDNADLHYLAAVVYRRLGDLARAGEHLRRHEQAKPGTVVEDLLLAEIHALEESAHELLLRADQAMDRGRTGEALTRYRQSIDINPNLHESRVKYAYALSLTDRKEEALEQYRESLRLNAGTAIVHYNIGELLTVLERDGEAVASYETALGLDGGLIEARLSLADLLRRHRRFGDAAAHYRTVIAERPKDTAARFGRALCLIRQSLYGEAVSALEDDLRTCPGEPVFPHTLARILAACPRSEYRDGLRAAKLLEPLVKGPPNLDVAESVAMAMAETGRFDLAVQWQNRAIGMARDSGLSEREPFLIELLQQYKAGRPCRSPWREDDPLFYQKTYRRVLP